MTPPTADPVPPVLTPEEASRQKARARRSGQAILIFCVLAATLTVVAILSLDGAEPESPAMPADLPEGTEVFEVTSRSHVLERVDYPQTPPVGGDHNPTWWNCGAYQAPIVPEAAVHSLEHGAVWVTYDPGLPAEQVARVNALADQTYVLVSPWSDDTLPAPIVLSAWGAQLPVEELPSPEADEFLQAFRQGSNAPEPGAPCTGGASG